MDLSVTFSHYQITPNLNLLASKTPLNVTQITDIRLTQAYNFYRARNYVFPQGNTQETGIYKHWRDGKGLFPRKLIRTTDPEAVDIIQLDELKGLSATDQRLFWAKLKKSLDTIGHPVKYRHRFDLAADPKKMEELIQQLGGIDVVLAGVGLKGHVGYNEGGSDFDSPTREVELHDSSRMVLVDDFEGFDNTPTHAVTLGLDILSKAKQTLVQATGLSKAPIINKAIHGPITSDVPITYLRTLEGENMATIIVDQDAISQTDLSPFNRSQVTWGIHA